MLKRIFGAKQQQQQQQQAVKQQQQQYNNNNVNATIPATTLLFGQ